VHLYEDLEADPQGVLRAICEFDSGPGVPTVGRHNVGGGAPGNRWIDNLVNERNGAGRAFGQIVPVGVADRLRGLVVARTPTGVDPQVRAELVEEFRVEILQLQDLIDRDLSAWLRLTAAPAAAGSGRGGRTLGR